jgi:hypothetical protein
MPGQGKRYGEFKPPASLRPFVRTIWTYASPAPDPVVQRIGPQHGVEFPGGAAERPLPRLTRPACLTA